MTTAEQLLDEAMKLPDGDRETLVVNLIASFNRDAHHDEVWEVEIRRRLAELERGDAELIAWDEVRKALFAGLNDSAPA